MSYEYHSSGFVGRERELHEIERFFSSEERSILLVTGEFGSGKTALVQHALKDHASRGIEYVVYINSWRLIKTSDVFEHIVKSLNPRLSLAGLSFAHMRDRAISSVRGKSLLIVIDELDRILPEHQASLLDPIVMLLREGSLGGGTLKIILVGRSRLEEELPPHILQRTQKLTLGPLTKEEMKRLFEVISGGLKAEEFTQESGLLMNLAEYDPSLFKIVPFLIRELGEKAVLSNFTDQRIRESSIHELLEKVFATLPESHVSLLGVLSRFEASATAEELRALSGIRKLEEFNSILENLQAKNLIIANEWTIEFSHKLLKEFVASRVSLDMPEQQSGILYITFDPQIVSKDEVLAMLLTLNQIYRSLGGCELIIQDEEIRSFGYFPEVVYS